MKLVSAFIAIGFLVSAARPAPNSDADAPRVTHAAAVGHAATFSDTAAIGHSFAFRDPITHRHSFSVTY